MFLLDTSVSSFFVVLRRVLGLLYDHSPVPNTMLRKRDSLISHPVTATWV